MVWNGSDQARPQGLVNPALGRRSAPFLYSRSNGSGTRFEPQRDLTHRSFGIDGGGSVAANTRGEVFAAWHALPVGEQAEDHRAVWIARSGDDGATFSVEQRVSPAGSGACGCCGLEIAAGSAGRLFILFRSAATLVDRDLHLLQSDDDGRSFRGSLVQPWNIGACPMSSMSLAISGRRVIGAWETAGQVYFGEVDERAAGIPMMTAAPGESQVRKHPRLVIGADRRVLLVWTDGAAWARGGSAAWQLFEADGRATPVKGLIDGVPAWSFAAAVARPDGGFVLFY